MFYMVRCGPNVGLSQLSRLNPTLLILLVEYILWNGETRIKTEAARRKEESEKECRRAAEREHERPTRASGEGQSPRPTPPWTRAAGYEPRLPRRSEWPVASAGRSPLGERTERGSHT